jgi:ribosome-associated protein
MHITSTAEKRSVPLPHGSGDEEKLLSEVVSASLEAKGKNLVVIKVSECTSIADYFVIVSGRSDRQVQGIANRILDTLYEKRIKPSSVEGTDKGQWAVIDFGFIIVHVFYEPLRDFYDLEGFWSQAPRIDVQSNVNE